MSFIILPTREKLETRSFDFPQFCMKIAWGRFIFVNVLCERRTPRLTLRLSSVFEHIRIIRLSSLLPPRGFYPRLAFYSPSLSLSPVSAVPCLVQRSRLTRAQRLASTRRHLHDAAPPSTRHAVYRGD